MDLAQRIRKESELYQKNGATPELAEFMIQSGFSPSGYNSKLTIKERIELANRDRRSEKSSGIAYFMLLREDTEKAWKYIAQVRDELIKSLNPEQPVQRDLSAAERLTYLADNIGKVQRVITASTQYLDNIISKKIKKEDNYLKK